MLVVLLAGIWLGGRHSDWLPGPLRAALVGDEDTRGRRARRSTTSTTPTTARSRKDKLADNAIDGVVRQARRPLLALLRPRGVPALQAGAEQRVLRASGVTVGRAPARAARRGRLRRLAGQARRHRARATSSSRPTAGRCGAAAQEVGLARQGPAGQPTCGSSGCTTAGAATKRRSRAATVSVPVVASQMRARRRAAASASCAWRSSARAPTPRSTTALRRLSKRGAEGVRARPARQRRRPGHRGPARRQRVPAPTARSSPPAGARCPSARCSATGDAGRPRRRRSSCSSTATRRRRRRSSPARCRTASRAKVVGTRTFGKGVFQEVIELSNGGALDITAGQYFTPNGRNLGGKGVTPGRASRPTCGPRTTTKTQRDEALARALRGAGPRVPRVSPPRGAPRGRGDTSLPRRASCCSSSAGASSSASRSSSAAGGVTVERSRDAAPGRLALLQAAARARRRGRPGADRAHHRAPGRRARRHRGADARPRPVAALPAGRRARRARGARRARPTSPARRDLTDLVTFTIDPASARDFDDAISAERAGRRATWRIWVHIADVSAYVRPGSPVDREAYRRATSVYVPGAVEPMLPEALSNDACSLRPDVERLAVTVEMELHGAEVAPGRLLPLEDPLRRAPRLRAGRPDLRRRGGGARSRGPARWPPRARPRPRLQRRREARGRAGHRGRRARVRVRPARSRDRPARDASRPSRTG